MVVAGPKRTSRVHRNAEYGPYGDAEGITHRWNRKENIWSTQFVDQFFREKIKIVVRLTLKVDRDLVLEVYHDTSVGDSG